MNLIGIAISYIFVSNIILSRFLGLCPFIGVSKNPASALAMGIAATAVISLSSLLSASLYYLVLLPLQLQWLRLLAFMLLIVSLVQLVELLLEHYLPLLHGLLGIYLPLMSSNCAVLGVVLWNIDVDRFNPIESFTAGFAAGIGFTLALLLMSAIRDKLSSLPLPSWLQGQASYYLSAALLALAFKAFDTAMLERLVNGW